MRLQGRHIPQKAAQSWVCLWAMLSNCRPWLDPRLKSRTAWNAEPSLTSTNALLRGHKTKSGRAVTSDKTKHALTGTRVVYRCQGRHNSETATAYKVHQIFHHPRRGTRLDMILTESKVHGGLAEKFSAKHSRTHPYLQPSSRPKLLCGQEGKGNR